MIHCQDAGQRRLDVLMGRSCASVPQTLVSLTETWNATGLLVGGCCQCINYRFGDDAIKAVCGLIHSG